MARTVDPDWQNIKSIRLTHVKVRTVPARFAPDGVTGFYRLAQVTVAYIVRWRRITTDDDGPGVRFLYVTQQKAHAPWRIASIGSGP